MSTAQDFEDWCEQGDYVDYGLPRLYTGKDSEGNYIYRETEYAWQAFIAAHTMKKLEIFNKNKLENFKASTQLEE